MLTPQTSRPTWAEVDLNRLGENFRAVKSFCGDRILYMAVIKADAYGHGAIECGKRLEADGADWFGVATLEEGVELRQAGISKPILIFGGVWPGQAREFLNFDLTPMIFTLEQAEWLNDAARAANRVANLHVKIDTGMNRVGFRPEQAADAARYLASLHNATVEGLMTHFAVADKLSENEFTNRQIATFSTAVETFLAAGHRPALVDLANSPAAVAHPHSRAKLVRIGGILFGVTDDVLPEGVERPELNPVMSVHSKIAMVKSVPRGETIGYSRTYTTKRDSLIATVPIGYNDGYDRALSNKGEMVVRGKKVPVVGRVSMDWVTVDVTDVPEAKAGDAVVVLGSDGEAGVTAEDIARKIDTISYEVTCGISSRIQRIYK
jgi:alanine racemase